MVVVVVVVVISYLFPSHSVLNGVVVKGIGGEFMQQSVESQTGSPRSRQVPHVHT